MGGPGVPPPFEKQMVYVVGKKLTERESGCFGPLPFKQCWICPCPNYNMYSGSCIRPVIPYEE